MPETPSSLKSRRAPILRMIAKLNDWLPIVGTV
jgi:hypothetical protein